MNLVLTLNHLAGPWSAWMRFALFDGTFVLGSAGLVWLVARRRASSQFGYLLFLLVLVPLAVPLPLNVPAPLAWLSPRYAAGQSVTWLERLAVGRNESTADQRSDESLEKAGVERGAQKARWTTAHADLLPHVASADRTADETPPTLSLRALLMLGWATTVVALMARFAWVQSGMARRLKIARWLDPKSLPFDFAELRGRMGLRREVRLATSEIVASPAVWGLWRPRLVLPPSLVEHLPRGQLAWVLSHELAHVRRGDLYVVLLQKLVQIVYFFHPAVWLANWLVDRQRECACDDAALAVAACPGRECGTALVTVVERACGVPPLPALGLFHSQAFLRRRITRLVACQDSVPRRLSWASVGCLGLLAVTVLPRVNATEVPNPKKPVATSQDQIVDDERSSDTLALADDPPAEDADEANDGSDVQRSAVVLAERNAAMQAIRKARGQVYPDFKKLAVGERNIFDPKHNFIGASFRPGKVTDDTLALLAHFPELERVDLVETEISDAALERLAPLHKIRRLGLDKSTISDIGLAHLGQLRELRVLRLSDTGMTDAGL
ncbi:MAG TPA: M56 family metallopeptidase, partial [Pirellulales bacterium]|nr:M56 family metallopeptidase [Pirellulales bacterium]